MTDRFDVVIVGGGLVGASLAIALAPLDLRVALVDAAPAGVLPPVFDERNLSFSEATVHALDALGVLAHLRAPAGAIRRIHVSRRGDFGRVLLDARDHGREEFGRVVVARDFGDALEARLAALPALVRLRGARCTGVSRDADGTTQVALETADGPRVLSARLLVAADGARSPLRDALGIGVTEHDHGQVLFVARLRTARVPDGTAYERLTADGPTALLPRGDRHYGLVHAVAIEDADAVAALDDAAFLARVQDVFGWRAGRFEAVGARSRHPALAIVADRLVASGAVLVGNAAQSLHPVGAQGFNLGLRDALVLAEVVAAHRDAPGSDTALRSYAARREDDRSRTIAFSDGLARISSNPVPAARLVRSAGLWAAERSRTLQASLVAGAMGYRGDVPALSRGAAA